MLSNEGINKLNAIEEIAKKIWDEKLQIKDVKILNYPFDAFEIKMVIYEKFDIKIEYDRSIVAINLKQQGTYENIRKIVKEEFVRGFESSKRENIEHNLRVLDNVLKNI